MQNRREFLRTLTIGAAGIAILPRIVEGRSKDAWDTLYAEILGRIKPDDAETLRRGLASRRITAQRQPFKISARDLGNLKPGLSIDNVAELVEQLEGPLHR